MEGEGGGKHPPPVIHQPKKPGANRVKRITSSISLSASMSSIKLRSLTLCKLRVTLVRVSSVNEGMLY